LDTRKYIGINYEFNGRTLLSADCLGLISLIFEDNHWLPHWDDFRPIEKGWYIKEPYRMLRFLCKNFITVRNMEDLVPNDLLYFNIGGEGHLGLFLEYGRCLTTFPPTEKQWDGTVIPSRSMIIHKQQWSQGFISGFRRR